MEELRKIIENKGIDKAKDWFCEVKDVVAQINKYKFGEGPFVSLGYQFLEQDDTGTAIEVFRMATEAHPNAYSTWDSLAESYMKNGEFENAILNYEKSLELNPDNKYAVEQIEKMRR